MQAPLRLLTLNLAHGVDLGGTAALLGRERPDVAALQEVGGGHAQRLSGDAGLPHLLSGRHARILGYGTALLSRHPLRDPGSARFPHLLPKGWVSASLPWAGAEVTVVSVHLDFLLPSVRREQALHLVRALSRRRGPLVVMGDLNCGPGGEPLRILREGLGVSPCRPEDPDLATFPLLGRRLDWILASPDLAFRAYRVLPDAVSDHRAVLTEIVPSGTDRN